MNGRVSRRQFIAAAGAGISVKVGFLGRPASAALIANPSDGSLNWIGPDGRPRFRMDAVAKVTGDKTVVCVKFCKNGVAVAVTSACPPRSPRV